MPSIPTYERQTAAPDTVRAHVPQMSGASPIGQGIVDLGRGVGQLTSDLQREDAIRKQAEEKQAEERARVWAGQQAGATLLDEQQRLDAAQKTAPAGADGFAKTYLEGFDQRAATAVAAAPDEPSKRFLQQHIIAQRTHMGTQAQTFQFREGDRDVVDRHGKSVDTWAQVVAADPRQYDAALKVTSETLPDVNPDVREKLTEYTRKALGNAAATHVLGADPRLLYDLTGKALNVQPSPAARPAAAGAADAPAGSFQPGATDPRGIRNNNPGNIRLPAPGARGDSWLGQVAGNDAAFVTFDSPASGIRAMSKNLLSYQDSRGINTVQGLISRWAPPSENDTGAYVKAVAAAAGVKPDDPINLRDPATMQAVVGAMIQHENGKNPYGADVVKQGVASALGLGSLNPPAPAPLPTAPLETPVLVDGQSVKTGVGWIDSASPEQITQWRHHAFTEMQRTNSADRTALAGKVKDFQAMVLTGTAPPPSSVPTQEEYARAYGPASAHQYQAEVADYVGTGNALRQLGTASAADRANIIRGAAPAPGADYANRLQLQQHLVQANALIEKQIVADPAAYSARTAPKVQQAWSAMQSVMNDKQASDLDRRAAASTFAQATIAEQERLGVSTIRGDVLGEEGKKRVPGPRLLTNGQANDIAGAFAKKPADAAQIVGALEKQWGSYWPQVYGQLAADDKLPPAALVIPNMSDPWAREQLARIADPKVQKELKAALPAGAEKDIDTKLDQLNAPFLNSLMFQSGGIDTHAVVASQQKALAASYVAGGKSAGDAAKLAFEQTVGWAYSFEGSMRIPKKEVPEVVKAGTARIAVSAAQLDIAVPPSFRAGMTPEARRAAWNDAIRVGATFVTNADESGLTLHVAAKTDAGMDALFAVRRDDGVTPVSWSWSQLRDQGVQEANERRAQTDALYPPTKPSSGPINAVQRAAQDDLRRRREIAAKTAPGR